jgi:hypothetical protein
VTHLSVWLTHPAGNHPLTDGEAIIVVVMGIVVIGYGVLGRNFYYYYSGRLAPKRYGQMVCALVGGLCLLVGIAHFLIDH